MNASVLQQILNNEDTLFFVVGGTVALVAIVLGTIGGVVKALSRERTKREIAAYIAEGTMTPEQGERLLKAGKSC